MGRLINELQDKIIKLEKVVDAYRGCDMSLYHIPPCRHEYRHCTCGKDDVDAALKELDSE